MSQTLTRVMECAMSHMENGIPIQDLGLTEPNKRRLIRVFDLYYRWIANRHLDPKAMLRELWPDLDRYAIRQDLKIFHFILEQSEEANRKMDELKVRGMIDDMARIGRAQGDWKPIEAAAKALTKVAGLDRPENPAERLDRVSFLPTIFTTDIKDIDPDRERISADQRKQLASKYGGIIDEHGALIERRKAEMRAEAAMTESDEENAEATEVPTEEDGSEQAVSFGYMREVPCE